MGGRRAWDGSACASEIERREKENLVVIEDLIQSKGRVESLMDVMVRPSPDPKRVLGTVEIHENGLRYRSNKGSRIGALHTHALHAHDTAPTHGRSRGVWAGRALRPAVQQHPPPLLPAVQDQGSDHHPTRPLEEPDHGQQQEDQGVQTAS